MTSLYGRLAVYFDNNIIESLSQKNFDLFNSSGFLLGDSFFTTILAVNGQIIEGYLNEHVERLLRSFELLTEFRPEKHHLLNFILEQSQEIFSNHKNQSENNYPESLSNHPTYHRFRITFIRIDREKMVHNLLFNFGVAFHVNCLNSNPINSPSQSALLYRGHQITPSPYSTVKTINRTIFNLALRRASELMMDKVILTNNKGNIACSANANIFILIGEKLITPPLSEGVLDGVLRKKILEHARSISVNINEDVITQEMLSLSDGVFLTNSIIFISPVNYIVSEIASPEEPKIQLFFSPNSIITLLKDTLIKKIIPENEYLDSTS